MVHEGWYSGKSLAIEVRANLEGPCGLVWNSGLEDIEEHTVVPKQRRSQSLGWLGSL